MRKVEHVKRNQHGRTVGVREVFCVYVKSKSTKPTLPGTMPSRTVRLHAHLDPSFVQSPTDPLAVAYSFSAAATEEGVTLAAQITPSLPSGVLALYSDGLLKCSVDVGGNVAGGECPVTYSATGTHTVVTTYTSGTLSATETYTEQIEPYTTSTSDSATVETESGYPYNPAEEPRVWTVTASVSAPGGGTVNGNIQYTILDTTTGAESRGVLPTGTLCQIQENINPFRPEHERSFRGCGASLTVANTDSIVLEVSFLGAPGYLPSTGNALGI